MDRLARRHSYWAKGREASQRGMLGLRRFLRHGFVRDVKNLEISSNKEKGRQIPFSLISLACDVSQLEYEEIEVSKN